MIPPGRGEQTPTGTHSPSSLPTIVFYSYNFLMTSPFRCVGVFDTVGSLGLPEELTFGSKKLNTIFGFPDKLLGEHIQHAFHALALNETRADFVSISNSSRATRIDLSNRIVLNLNKLKVGFARSKL
jgi:hypothetical protein